MKAKNISVNHALLLEYLIKKNKSFLTVKDVQEAFPNQTSNAIRIQLSKMVKMGLLLRITGGLYNVIPFEQDANNYFPNWHQLAAALIQPKEYYIGFYSAMELHGLITQPSMIEQVVTRKRILPKRRLIRNVRFEIITLSEKRFFGMKKQWIDDFNQVYCSDLEKTFVDCLYKPNYAGGITEIVKAIFKSKNKIDTIKLEEYALKFNAQVVMKRLGFILDKLQLFPDLQNRLLNKLTNSYERLDPSLPKNGINNSRWKIIDNINIESSVMAIQT